VERVNPASGETSYSAQDGTAPRVGAAATSSEADVADRALLARILQRNAHAFATFYDRWSATVRGLVARIVGEPADTDEVVEEVFWQVWQQADRFDGERGRVAVWLLTIARSRALDRVRARKRRRDDVADTRDDGTSRLDQMAADDSAFDPAEFADQRARVAAALSGLPGEQCEVVTLAYFSGLSQAEIAEQLDLPLGTVKTRTRLAFSKLRDSLANLWDDEP